MSGWDDIFVADCSGLSGAYCGKVLADLDMQVVVCRREAASLPRGWFANFYRSRHREVASVASVLDQADVVITSGRPSELRSAGLDYAALARDRPRLIVANISPFGLDGPRCEWRGANLVTAAAGGMVVSNGWPDGPPLQPLGLQAYHCAGLHAALGVLLALRVRESTGAGQLVDIAQQESVLGCVEHLTSAFREDSSLHPRAGTLHWTRAYRSLPARDGALVATHLGDWQTLRAWVEADGGSLDVEGWDDPEARRRDCEELFDRLAAWTEAQECMPLVEAAQARRLAFAPIQDLVACADDPHLRARGFYTERVASEQKLCLPGPLFRPPAEGGSAARVAASPTAGALAGVRVLDLTWVVAGPVATRLFADFGAEVVKVEHPASDPAMQRGGGSFGNLHRGKKSIVLDLSGNEGLEVLRELIRHSDVLVENFSSRVLANWGLEDDALCRLNPKLAVVHMSGFGSSGPRRHWVSYGPALHAVAGYTSHMRHRGGPAAGWGYSYSDMVSGYAAALAGLAALRAGGFQAVDLAQLEVLASMVGAPLVAAANGESPAAAIGNASQEGMLAPHGVFPCRADGGERWCAIVVEDDAAWRRFAAMIDQPWAADARFATADSRWRLRDEVDAGVRQWTSQLEVERLVEQLQAIDVAAAVVADARDLLLRDKHLRARGAFVEVGAEPAFELDATPVRLAAGAAAVAVPGPALGAHTDEVLREWAGYDAARIESLRRAGVVR